jgi:threonine dehydrogenase-like Zn-dependent dehydrogenase
VPEGVDPKCAVIAALAGVAYNGVLESRIALGETAVVFGLGVVGQCVCFQIRRAGAFRVIAVDPIARRRETALKMGADVAIDPAAGDIQEQVKAANDGEWADVILETSGVVAALNDALKIIKNQSLIVALSWYSGDASGLDLSKDFHFRRVNIRVPQAGSVPVELSARWTHERKFRSALRLMPEMRLGLLVTHTLPFEEASRAYEMVDKRPEDCIQVVLQYPE